MDAAYVLVLGSSILFEMAPQDSAGYTAGP
jgi:hypothetical protein